MICWMLQKPSSLSVRLLCRSTILCILIIVQLIKFFLKLRRHPLRGYWHSFCSKFSTRHSFFSHLKIDYTLILTTFKTKTTSLISIIESCDFWIAKFLNFRRIAVKTIDYQATLAVTRKMKSSGLVFTKKKSALNI